MCRGSVCSISLTPDAFSDACSAFFYKKPFPIVLSSFLLIQLSSFKMFNFLNRSTINGAVNINICDKRSRSMFHDKIIQYQRSFYKWEGLYLFFLICWPKRWVIRLICIRLRVLCLHRQNINRALVTTDKRVNRMMGHRVSVIYKYEDYEFGCVEVGKIR